MSNSSKPSIIDSPTIVDRLKEIQRTEGRSQTVTTVIADSEDHHRHFMIAVVPFYEAPIGVRGLVRFARKEQFLRMGRRCQSCPLSPTVDKGCMCYDNGTPIQFVNLPPGWVPGG